MSRWWKIAVPLACVAVIGGAAILWSVYKHRVAEQRLADAVSQTRARAERGDAKAEFELGSMYYHGKGVLQSYAEALRWLRKAADQGNVKAQCAIGYMYSHGQGVPQDYPEALRWCSKAADQGDARAEDALAGMYYDGKEVPQNYGVAVRWYRKAADQGDAWGEDGLGFAYYEGKGVPQDYGEAVHWFRKSADQGFASGQYDLGCMYDNGKGVQQNYTEAYRWYRKAAAQGDERAKRVMKLRVGPVSKFSLWAVFLGSLFFLAGSRGSIRYPQKRAETLTGLLGLFWVGLRLYGVFYFGILEALSALSAFDFAEGVVGGMLLTRFIFVLWARSAKFLLQISAILFIGLNILVLLVIVRHGLTNFAHAVPVCYSAEGWLVGMSIPALVTLWLHARKDQPQLL